MYRPNRLKQRIRQGLPSMGVWLQSGSPVAAEIASLAGFDFLMLDLEHGMGGISEVTHLMRAAQAGEATIMVRTPWKDPVLLNRLLDAGAEGVLVPQLETGEEAQAIADACRYPPEGRRGNAWGVARAASYGFAADRFAEANANLVVMVQIESRRAVENAAAIAAVEGIDACFIGPYDLSGSIGRPGEIDHQETLALIRETEEKARAAGMPLASIPRPDADFATLFDQGYCAVVDGGDILFLHQAMEKAAGTYRAWANQRGNRAPPA